MKFYKVGFFILLLLILGGAAFYLGQSYNKPADEEKAAFTKQETTKTKKDADKIATDSSQSSIPSPTLDYLKENIVAAINTGNTQPFETYMADEVNVILEASECCGILNNVDATQQLEYLKDAEAPWNFDQSNETIKKLKATEPEKYGPESAFVGIASNEYTVSFKFNADNKISAVTMAATYKLILP